MIDPTPSRLLLLAALGLSPFVVEARQSAPEGPAAPAAPAEVVDLPVFEVRSGEADGGYAATNVVSGTRANEAIRNLPMNISVVTRELLDDLKATNVAEAVQFTTGVTYDEERNTSFSVRGFRVWIPRRNGFRSVPWIQMANVERIEFIRGPASLLYGQADPGGIINYLTKRPKEKAGGSLNLTVGSWDFRQVHLDLTGPLNEAATLLYRLNVQVQESDGFTDFAQNDSLLVAPSLTAKLFDGRTRLLLDYEYVKTQRNFGGPLPRLADPAPLDRYPTFPNNRFYSTRFAEVPREFSLNGPDTFDDGESHLVQGEVQHRFAEDLQARVAFQYTDRRDDTYRSGGNTFRNETGFFARNNVGNAGLALTQNQRTLVMSDRDIRGLNLQADLVWKKDLGFAENQFMLFAERGRSLDTEFREPTGLNPPEIRLAAPAWDDPAWNPNRLFSDSDSRNWAVSISDSAALFDKRLRVLGGMRYEQSNPRNTLTGSDETQSRWTPQAGANFFLLPNLSVYALYSEAFTQQFQRQPEDGEWAEPVLGVGQEAGFKFDFLDGRVSGMLAFFETTRENQFSTITRDPAPAPGSGISDRITVYRDEKSRGVEFDAILEPVKGWQVTMGYAYLEAFVTNDPSERDLVRAGEPSILGETLANAPEHRFNLLTRYNFRSGPLKGAHLGGGVIHVGERRAELSSRTLDLWIPSYTRFDVFAGYAHRVGRTRVAYSVRVENVADEEYIQSANSFGAPVNVRASVRFTF